MRSVVRLPVLSLVLMLALTACSSIPENAPPTVGKVDLSRYIGVWHEVAAFPAWFQDGCVATRAEYRLRDDGKISVTNSCRDEALDGPARVATATARLDPAQTDGSRLLVSFFPPFEGWYWILALDPDYRWSLVGSPDRRYLWILARDPVMDPETYAAITAKAAALGFDIVKLQKTIQPQK